MIAATTPKCKTADDLIALVRSGYTIRLGTRTTGRVLPSWDWQLFTPEGEFIEPVSQVKVAALKSAGLGDNIHGIYGTLRGIGR